MKIAIWTVEQQKKRDVICARIIKYDILTGCIKKYTFMYIEAAEQACKEWNVL